MKDKSVAVISLGCDKNRVDTEGMLYRLSVQGFRLTPDLHSADILIVNTCAFIESARKEAVETILELAEIKAQNPYKKLIVTGCLPQKYLSEIQDELPEVDAFLGVRDYDRICETVERLFNTDGRLACTSCGDAAEHENRFVTTPPHYAYLRISDGCDNRCTYCTIPSIRGPYSSRSIESLISEAKNLCEGGAEELILVAQDVTRYGSDRYNEYKLTELLQRLTAETPVRLIRLMYCYPELLTDELLREVAQNPKIAKYLDIPFQHTEDRILKLMNRRSRRRQLISLMERIRKSPVYIAVRTTLMVGFPGETEDEFNAMCSFVSEYKPDHVGIFAYSKESGTPSAKLKGHLPKAVKRERVARLGELHLTNCRQRNRLSIGTTQTVVYEGIDYDRNLFIGRTEHSAPEIDVSVFFKGKFADIGKYYQVKITGFDNYDLIGEMTEE